MPIYKSFNAFSWERQKDFGGRVVAAKRRTEALPGGKGEIPRERITLKFRDEDAELVTAKVLKVAWREMIFLQPRMIPGLQIFPGGEGEGGDGRRKVAS